MQLKIGQIYKVKPGREYESDVYMDNDGAFIKITNIDSSYLYYDILDKDKKTVSNSCSCFKEEDLVTLEDINYPYEGMIVVDEDGDERMVLGTCGQVVFLSNFNNFDEYGCGCTIRELIRIFKAKDQEEEEVTELTMDEIADKFGVDVKNMKIKKEE